MLNEIIDDRNRYDVVVPCSYRNLKTLQISIPFIKKNLKPKRIVIVSNDKTQKELLSMLHEDNTIVFINEDSLIPGLTLELVSKCIREKLQLKEGEKYAGNGWYFQQFLKLAYSLVCKDDEYLIWDADVIPLRQIDHMENRKYIFYYEDHDQEVYFTMIRRLLGEDVRPAFGGTFVVDQMIFNRDYVRELIELIIQKGEAAHREVFWKCIIELMEPEEIRGGGFSEFETYGEYVHKEHESSFVIKPRPQSTCLGNAYFGKEPSVELLEWAGRDLDTVSFENFVGENPLLQKICKMFCGRISFSAVMKPYEWLIDERSRFSYRVKKLKKLLWHK